MRGWHMAWLTAKGAVLTALAGNIACALAKIAGYAASGSSALLSEAIHSLAAIAHQILLLFGLQQSDRPADARYAFGHAKEIYFWSFIAAILLFSHAAGVAIYEGIQKLKAPPFLSISDGSILALAAALAVQLALLVVLRRMPATDAQHKPVTAAVTIEAIAGITGSAVALAGVIAAAHLGLPQADAFASLAVGFVMAATAVVMSLKIKSVIVGEAAGPGVRSAIRGLVAAETAPGRPIATIHDVRTLQLGLDDVLVAANVAFRDGESAASVEETSLRLDRAIKAQLPQVSHVFLAVQPVDPSEAWDEDEAETDAAETIGSSRQHPAGQPHASNPASGGEPQRKRRNKKRRRH